MNFWEARQAALEGKKVKMADGFECDVGFFTESGAFDIEEINGEWEIVEEPKLLYTYLNTYEDCHGQALNTKGQADAEGKGKGRNAKGRTGCIEIITDIQGRLISAKNV